VSIRITQGMSQRRLLTDLQAAHGRVDRAQREMSTQKRILKPSDDPIGAQRAVLARGELAANAQYQTNVTQARGFMETTDEALDAMTSLLHRARELTVQGANDATGPSARNNIALEIDQIVAAVKQAANTSYGGVYVFAGTDTTNPPYDTTSVPPVDTYGGDGNVVAREVGPGIAVQVNTLVDQGPNPLLGSGQTPGDTGLLRTLRDISDHLKSGTIADAESLRNGDLKALERNLDEIGVARAGVGATVARLDAADARLASGEQTTTQLLSETEDVDFAQATLALSRQQTLYEAALRSGASIIQPSLLDFLR
jgi:flagellar hook-associated protein 3 FlgL